MNSSRRVAVLAVAAAAGLAAVPAGAADPAEVRVDARVAHGRGVITVQDGTIQVNPDSVVIAEASGALVRTIPRYFRLDDFRFPVDLVVDADKVTLTPVLDTDRAEYDPAVPPPTPAQPVTPPQVWEGAAIGAVAGGITGAAAGCFIGAGIGAIVGGVMAAALAPFVVLTVVPEAPETGAGLLALPIGGAVGGCVLAGALGAGGGAVTGTLVGAAIGQGVANMTTNPPPPNP